MVYKNYDFKFMERNDKIYMGFGRTKGMGMIFKFLTRVLSRCYQSKCKKKIILEG